MKNIFFGMLVLLAALNSCRNSDDDGIQHIDQIIHLYIDSAGQDMLNTSIEGSYQSISANDENGTTDTAPVSFTNLYDTDSIKFLEYVSGANRILIDSSDANAKIYESEIEFTFTKKISDTQTSTFTGTLVLNYVLKPEVFEVQKAWYDQQLVFTKQQGQPNIIKVVK